MMVINTMINKMYSMLNVQKFCSISLTTYVIIGVLLIISCKEKSNLTLPLKFSSPDMYLEILEDSTYLIYGYEFGSFGCAKNWGNVSFEKGSRIHFFTDSIDKTINVRVIKSEKDILDSTQVKVVFSGYDSLNKSPIGDSFLISYSLDSIKWFNFASDGICFVNKERVTDSIIFRKTYFYQISNCLLAQYVFYSKWLPLLITYANTYDLNRISPEQLIFRNAPPFSATIVNGESIHMRCEKDSVFNQLFQKGEYHRLTK